MTTDRPKSTATVFMTFVLATLVGQFPAIADDRPHILLIVVDDQSPFDLQVYDPTSILQTPNIDRLASGGMVFDAAYHMGSWSGAVCTPSRHMIMSGRTVWHIPDQPHDAHHDPDLVPPNLHEHTLAAVFNRAGYDTMRTCKQGNSYAAANQQFTVSRIATKRGGNAADGSDWHADQVLEYLAQREATDDPDPFLIYFGFSHPHDPRHGMPELLAKYGATNHSDESSLPAANSKQPQLPVEYLSTHPFDNTEMDVRDEVAVSGVWKHRDERTIRNEIGREFACAENIDIQIGRVLDRLETMGELNNTYVFYTSDHGIAIGRHGLQGKQNLYEHTWRVPLIVMGPGVQRGARAPGNVYLLDLLATVCDLTGTEVPPTNEGLSFRAVLDGSQETVRETLYGVYCGGAKPGIRCVRQGDWKLIEYESAADNHRHTQLFNLATNPLELLIEHHDPVIVALTSRRPAADQRNLANDPRYQEKLGELQALLLAEMRRLDDPYRFSNQPDEALTGDSD